MSHRRTTHLAAAAAVVLVLTGCGTGDGADDPDDDLPDCSASDCTDEVAAYADALSGLEGVEEVSDVRYRGDQITAEPSVTGVVRVAAGVDCEGLEDEVGRLLWTSRVSPVSSVTLQCFLPGASGPDYDNVKSLFLLQDPDDLTSRWGPRGG